MPRVTVGPRLAEHHLLEESATLHRLPDARQVDSEFQICVEVEVHGMRVRVQQGLDRVGRVLLQVEDSIILGFVMCIRRLPSSVCQVQSRSVG